MRKTVLITGATGLLGVFLMKELLENGFEIIALARNKKNVSGKQRTESMLDFIDYKDAKKRNRVRIIEGDITKENLGLDEPSRNIVKNSVVEIYHGAASVDLVMPYEKIKKINLDGTRNVYDFALLCGIKTVHYISTAYIVGKKITHFKEDAMDLGQDFHNAYERSKFETEQIGKLYKKRGLNIFTYRPSIIVGAFRDGKTTNFRMVYQPLHFFANEIFQKFPGNLDTFQNLINVDILAKAITIISIKNENRFNTFHVTNPSMIRISEFIYTASDYFNFKIPQFIPSERFDYNNYTVVQKKLVSPYVPYFNYRTEFDCTNTLTILKENDIAIPKMDFDNLIRLFSFCEKKKFIKRKQRIF